MKCGVHNRHNPEHRYLSKTRYPHRKGVGSNIFQLSAEEVNLIRNYSYVHPIVLERIFKVTKHSLRQIQRGEKRKDIPTTEKFKPIAFLWKEYLVQINDHSILLMVL
jgi:hypothetical protein